MLTRAQGRSCLSCLNVLFNFLGMKATVLPMIYQSPQPPALVSRSSSLLPHWHNVSPNLLLGHQTTQCWSESGFISGDVFPAGVFWSRFKNPVNTFWRNHETLIQLINETSLFCFQNSVFPMLFSLPLSLSAIHTFSSYLFLNWVRHSVPLRGTHRSTFHLLLKSLPFKRLILIILFKIIRCVLFFLV